VAMARREVMGLVEMGTMCAVPWGVVCVNCGCGEKEEGGLVEVE
jgi:hypothetical protein